MKHLNRSIFSCSFLLPLSKLCVFLVLLFIPLLVPLESWGQSAAWDSFSKLRFGPAAATEEANGTSYPVLINKNRPNPLGNLVELPIAGILATTQTASSKGIGLLTNGYIGFLGSGTFGGLGITSVGLDVSEDRWTSIGDRINFQSSPNGQKSTGIRSQWNKYSLVCGLQNRNLGVTLPKDGLIEWTDLNVATNPNNLDVGSSILDYSNLRFVFNNPIEKREVMTITPKGRVGIETTNPAGKLSVYQGDESQTDIGIFSFYNNRTYTGDNNATYAIFGNNNGGPEARADNFLNVGIGGFSGATAVDAVNIGVSGAATQSNRNIGVYGAVYESSGYQTPQGAYPDLASSWAGYFSGDVGITGSSYDLSDETLKTGIKPILRPLEIINALSPKTYKFKKLEKPSALTVDTKRQSYGFLAQELEKVLPELVKEAHQFGFYDSTSKIEYEGRDFKMVNYTAIIPILVAAVQEQTKIIEDLKSKLGENDSNRLTNIGQNNSIAGKSSLIVSPNPFNKSIEVKISNLARLNVAQLLMTDLSGKAVYNKFISGGSGVEVINLPLLPSGVYIVSLWSEGSEVSSLKVVKN